ncbi:MULTISPECIES: YbbR-like domain-containing protein [Bhargavaea]|uniref:YbbR-like domain-containing protein n=1 Tax=Bhargavaea changchunensis TaxID=2134037 RepID=A0ABW2NI88_9BACL|nr:CdaR family protein [Bhargavaea sp. CC-171006]
MDKFMDNPWFIRGIALFFAVLMFLVVQSDEEQGSRAAGGTDIAVLQDVPIEVYYDDENTVVTGAPETVSVTIEGPGNLVRTTRSLKDFTVFVDLRALTMGAHEVTVQTENLSEKLEVSIDPETVDVVIEERISQEFRVDPEMNERLLAENHVINSLEAEPSTVMVTGAKSVIESISFVKASVTADPGVDGPLEQQASVRVLDRDLNKLNVIIEPAEVTVKADISEYSRSVQVALEQSGTPEEGVTIDSISTATETVKLFGPRNVLDEIGELSVAVDVSEVTASGKVTVELKKPAGVTKVSPGSIDVDVRATVNGNDEETAEAPDETEEQVAESGQPEEEEEPESPAAGSAADGDTAQSDESGPESGSTAEEEASGTLDGLAVEVRGLEEGQTGEVIQPDGPLSLKIRGPKSAVDSAKSGDFKLFVNAGGVSEGEASLVVHVDGPSGIKAEPAPGRVTVRIATA